MKTNIDLQIECNPNGNILVKAGDQTLYTCANARELTPWLTRLGMDHDEASQFLTEAIVCLAKMLRNYKEKINGGSKK